MAGLVLVGGDRKGPPQRLMARACAHYARKGQLYRNQIATRPSSVLPTSAPRAILGQPLVQ